MGTSLAPGLRCPLCEKRVGDKVVDSRTSSDGSFTRRRRECLSCGKRYTTYEYMEDPMPLVASVASTEGAVAFDRGRLLASIRLALPKHPVVAEETAAMVEARILKQVETTINPVSGGRPRPRCVTPAEIAGLVLERLRQVRPVAAVLYASHTEDFQTLDQFVRASEPKRRAVR